MPKISSSGWTAGCLALLLSAGLKAEIGQTVVLAAREDRHFSLAEEIAEAEAIPLATSLDQVADSRPRFLLWVTSPDRLNDELLLEMGLFLRSQSGAIAVGLITGSTIDAARSLWQRAPSATGNRVFAVNGQYPSARVFEGRIWDLESGEGRVLPLTTGGLREALARSDYLTFTGHGGSSYWRLSEDELLTADDVPELPPVVVATASCQTFRPWEADSIALRFVDQGAAAYVGFAYSPVEGYLIGEFDGLPLRLAWPGFTVGQIVRVQTRGTLRGFAEVPFYWLLGDPRLTFRETAPYRLVDDREVGDARILEYADASAGMIPVRIPGGARYRFVEVPGVTAASSSAFSYNARLEMVDVGEDKLVLFAHRGGRFTLRLRERPGVGWTLADAVVDGLDQSLLFGRQSGGGAISMALAAVVGWIVWRTRSGRTARGALPSALVVGLGLALLHAAYWMLRLEHLTITTKPVSVSWLALLGTLLLTALAAFLFLTTRSWRGRLAALLLATLPALAAALFGFGFVIAANELGFRPRLGTALYGTSMGELYLVGFVCEFVILALVFAAARRHAGVRS